MIDQLYNLETVSKLTHYKGELPLSSFCRFMLCQLQNVGFIPHYRTVQTDNDISAFTPRFSSDDVAIGMHPSRYISSYLPPPVGRTPLF